LGAFFLGITSVLKFIRTFLLTAVLVPAVFVPAEAMAQGKVAVVSLQQAILNTDAAQKQLNTLRNSAEYKKSRAELEGLQKTGKEMVEKLKKDGPTMSKEQQAELTRKIENTRSDLEHVGRKLQEQEKELAQRLFFEMGGKAREVVNDLIKSENIGLLLDSQAALHADASYNITAKVTEKLNQRK
jgi:outer membrane protein